MRVFLRCGGKAKFGCLIDFLLSVTLVIYISHAMMGRSLMFFYVYILFFLSFFSPKESILLEWTTPSEVHDVLKNNIGFWIHKSIGSCKVSFVILKWIEYLLIKYNQKQVYLRPSSPWPSHNH
ncbi:hypothetical protein CROQUDRAFT_155348 [Cronartium quercuum f. sp. fusiforme G11]|uniref:Uncharacterized protein n=1 Tax=Cronartium quercuum f. sp. fusiforme G11 TaxID=708437 RepID=A0A9P6NWL1_9BASI|nr:hypothetical protein CROQUDRAFT_155348 [Cronartium quercuum f. sp. fusiforme G11]